MPRASCCRSMDVREAHAEAESAVAVGMASRQGAGTSKLLAALIALSLLVVLCVAVSLNSLFTVQSLNRKQCLEQKKDSGIYLEWIHANKKFEIFWHQSVELKQNTIVFPCSGPYMVYFSVRFCGEDMQANNTLSLLRDDRVLTAFHIQACASCCSKKEYKIFTFTKNDNVSLSADLKPKLRLEFLHLTFYYLLGDQCFE